MDIVRHALEQTDQKDRVLVQKPSRSGVSLFPPLLELKYAESSESRDLKMSHKRWAIQRSGLCSDGTKPRTLNPWR
jgi:hypothetical protein